MIQEFTVSDHHHIIFDVEDRTKMAHNIRVHVHVHGTVELKKLKDRHFLEILLITIAVFKRIDPR